MSRDIIGEMMGKSLGMGATQENQPHIHLISRGYLLGPISPFKGLQQGVKQLGPLSQGYHHFPYDTSEKTVLEPPPT